MFTLMTTTTSYIKRFTFHCYID